MAAGLSKAASSCALSAAGKAISSEKTGLINPVIMARIKKNPGKILIKILIKGLI
ncbi:MAG: hypothetical protein PHR74_04355 [Candidatus Omnitrophica bacterium]|jgi:hypothetical protein|nr:hypothetical protein [Candidatus Omnitrophota bacterium]